jgi:hypothetical protein
MPDLPMPEGIMEEKGDAAAASSGRGTRRGSKGDFPVLSDI